MISALEAIKNRYLQITEQIADSKVIADRRLFQKLTVELSELKPLVSAYEEYSKVKEALAEAEGIIEDGSDKDLAALAREEKAELVPRLADLERGLKLMLLPKDPNAGKNVLLEIRAGTGGEEAGLFAADLFRMYTRHAERRGWKMEVMSVNETGKGGFKEIIAMISGKDVYSRLKFESGVHRVQRVPETEASGRIHTSACTVAIMPEVEEVEFEIDPNEIKIDVYRASGHGGQSVNTTDSAVRITHIPTGMIVAIQDEKSQHKNKAKAMKILAARLKDIKMREEAAKRASERKNQVGTGDRSERIRTYNFSQGRVTDHRINLTLYKLDLILDGDIDELVDALMYASQEAALKDTGLAAAAAGGAGGGRD